MEIYDHSHGGLKPRLGVVITTWSHESGAAYARDLLNLFPEAAMLRQLEVIVCPILLESEDDVAKICHFFADKETDAFCIIAGNFTLDHVMPIMADALKMPVVLWGLPGREAWGSLVAIQQTVFSFKELKYPYRFVTGTLDDEDVWREILTYIRASAMHRRLSGLRIGLMGWRAQGMSDVIFDELALRQTFGVQLVNLGLTSYSRMMQSVTEQDIDRLWQQIKPEFDTTLLPDEVGCYGVRSYLALKEFATNENLQAITLECFHDHLGCPCLGFCMLNDQGIAAPCENDVPAAVLMVATQALTGEPTFHTDIVEADYANNWAVFHHCGNLPLRLASAQEKPALKPIRETAGPGAYGPTIQAWMKPGSITAANLVSGRSELRLCAMEGEVLPEKMDLSGSGAKVSFPFSLKRALEKLANEGYGHHFVLIQGHVGSVLAEWSALTGMKYVQIQPKD